VKKKAFYLMMVLTVIKSFLDPGSCPVSIWSSCRSRGDVVAFSCWLVREFKV
jgi:hypothetical protein